MNLILMTQYFDTLKDIGETSRSNTILIPHSPGHLGELADQIRNAVIMAGEVARRDEAELEEEPVEAPA
jgi:hypothetical protein